ncbi:MAG: family 10 glycosylhydrolase, partial [Firmicutes bacterium]|nr:family 10 glycosylhydrolase [Bacillota bacterium]
MAKKLHRILMLIAGLLALMDWRGFPVSAEDAVRPEVRALWVDAFNDGIKTQAQVDQLIHDSLIANINTLIVQVRRRGDAYFNNSIEPRTEDPDLSPGFDALQYLIDQAHANRIEVHAWLNTLVARHRDELPTDPNHVWNLHGPEAVGRDNWISYYRTYNQKTKKWSKKLNPSYFLDPGHPDVVDYTVAVHLNVVKNYDIDGIHLDYSRYAGKGWGYNPTSIARYNARFGTTGMPAPDVPRWSEWRREQTANLVRKIYLKAIALKPKLKVSSAVVTWGDGPVAEADWEKTRAYSEVFQDWRGWLEEGIIDQVMPMNYFCEWNPQQRLWYERWIEWEKNHQYGRQIVIGPGIFTNYIEHSLEQIKRAQAPSASG